MARRKLKDTRLEAETVWTIAKSYTAFKDNRKEHVFKHKNTIRQAKKNVENSKPKVNHQVIICVSLHDFKKGLKALDK